MLEELAAAMQRLARHVQPLTLRLGQPYLEAVHVGYVLLNVEQQRNMQTLSKLERERCEAHVPA